MTRFFTRAGGYQVASLVLTSFRLDGGAMFGSVPRVLWQRHHPPDAEHRIGLAARVLYLEGNGRRVLVDAGLGEKFGPRERAMYAVSPAEESGLPFRWEELTDLLLTHLHFDHAGGATRLEQPATVGEPPRARPRAPGARHHLQRINWDLARAPGPRERASYLPENVNPLEVVHLELADGKAEPLPQIWVEPSHGHTRGMQWVRIGAGREAVVFPADIVPTATHVHLPFVMGYDMCVETLLSEKAAFLEKAAAEGWTVVFAHDENVAAARVVRSETGKFSLGEVVA